MAPKGEQTRGGRVQRFGNMKDPIDKKNILEYNSDNKWELAIDWLKRVQPNETIRVMADPFINVSNNERIMSILEEKIDGNVNVKLIIINPCSKSIRLPLTRIQIIQTTRDLLNLSNKNIHNIKKCIEVRYYNYDTPEFEFLFKGYIFGWGVISIIPYSFNGSERDLLSNPYYLNRVDMCSLKNDPRIINSSTFSFNYIELIINYFDYLWDNRCVTIGQFLNKSTRLLKNKKIENIVESLENTYDTYINSL